MFSTVLWSSVYVPLTLFFFWSIDHGLLYYPWMACSYTRCTLDRIMEMNIGLKGFQATEISVQKHKQPRCTKQILAILHATRNGHHRVVRSCTIYLPQDVMATTWTVVQCWDLPDLGGETQLANMIWLGVALGHIRSYPMCLGHGAAWPALSISDFLIQLPSQKSQAHCLLCKYIGTFPNPAT